MPLTAGTKLDGYEVLSLLGAGGMGEVYLARDSVLKRDVAIKVLPAYLSQDLDRLRRFEQEAQAAAALNHPNILAVFQLGNFEGAPYLVSELLEGGTLRPLLQRGPLPARKTIELAVQIARGLAAAHEKGIVHRDLKPENLFVTKDGRIKILDFGLAKLVQHPPIPGDDAPTMTCGTDPGMVMGTAGYMAPEQARGKPVDHRADIFSFGAILYEMLAGKRAFEKPTAVETMTAILNEDPSPISQITGAAPPGLLRIVHRCLEKNPEQRFQSASDLAFAMDALSDSGSSSAAATGPPASRRAKSPLLRSAVVAAALLLAAATYFFLVRQGNGPTLRVSDYEQITHDGRQKTLSGTDGSRIYLTEVFPNSVGQVAVSGGDIAPVQVDVPDPSLMDVSPDGTTFLVVSYSGASKADDPIFSVRILGGSPRRLADGVRAAWSPDGESVVYSASAGGIYLMRSDGTGDHKLASIAGTTYSLSWSPDGSKIRFTGSKDGKLWEMSSSGSNLHQVPLAGQATLYPYQGRWASDGRFFFVSGGQIWMLDDRGGFFRPPSNRPVQLTSGPIGWTSPIPSRDGKKVYASGYSRKGELVRFDSKSGQFLPFLAGISAEFAAFSPDGKSVAYVSFPDGILYKANVDGSKPVQLTDPDLYPRLVNWSPDGTQILFAAQSDSDNHVKAYIVPSQGGRPQRLLPEDAGPEADAFWSPDGQKIVFASSKEAGGDPKSDLRIVDMATRQVTTVPGSMGMCSPRWSPDGRSIAAQTFDLFNLKIFDFATGQWSPLYTGTFAFPVWSRDSRYIDYLDYRSGNGIFRIQAKGGKPERVAGLKDVHYTGYYGLWLGLDATDAPLIMRDVGSDDIYALSLEEK
jgi:serine/threonine protein kinase/Tol biopolymer transport system component